MSSFTSVLKAITKNPTITPTHCFSARKKDSTLELLLPRPFYDEKILPVCIQIYAPMLYSASYSLATAITTITINKITTLDKSFPFNDKPIIS